MSKKPLTKKQHFVPQFYLRNFANSNNELHIYNAKERRIMKDRGASGICHDSFFYAAETGKPDDISQEVEDFFSAQIEDPLSKELPDIIKRLGNNEQITDNDKYTLAMFMNNMWLRNPTMRKQINDMEKKMLKWTNKMRYSHPSIDKELDKIAEEMGQALSEKEREDLKNIMINEEYDLKISNQSHLRFMLYAEHMQGFANLFFGQNWIVHISKCDRQFVTSDNPITVVMPEKMGFYGATFLERTHIFPLTPTIAIEAIYPHRDTGKKLKRKTHFKGAEKEIDRINLQIAGQAEYLYSSRPEEIKWFEDYSENIHRISEDNMKKLIHLAQVFKEE